MSHRPPQTNKIQPLQHQALQLQKQVHTDQPANTSRFKNKDATSKSKNRKQNVIQQHSNLLKRKKSIQKINAPIVTTNVKIQQKFQTAKEVRSKSNPKQRKPQTARVKNKTTIQDISIQEDTVESWDERQLLQVIQEFRRRYGPQAVDKRIKKIHDKTNERVDQKILSARPQIVPTIDLNILSKNIPKPNNIIKGRKSKQEKEPVLSVSPDALERKRIQEWEDRYNLPLQRDNFAVTFSKNQEVKPQVKNLNQNKFRSSHRDNKIDCNKKTIDRSPVELRKLSPPILKNRHRSYTPIRERKSVHFTNCDRPKMMRQKSMQDQSYQYSPTKSPYQQKGLFMRVRSEDVISKLTLSPKKVSPQSSNKTPRKNIDNLVRNNLKKQRDLQRKRQLVQEDRIMQLQERQELLRRKNEEIRSKNSRSKSRNEQIDFDEPFVPSRSPSPVLVKRREIYKMYSNLNQGRREPQKRSQSRSKSAKGTKESQVRPAYIHPTDGVAVTIPNQKTEAIAEPPSSNSIQSKNAKLKRSLNHLVSEQILKRSKLQQKRKLQQKEERDRVEHNLKKLERDIATLKKRERSKSVKKTRSKSQHRKSRVRSRSPEKALKTYVSPTITPNFSPQVAKACAKAASKGSRNDSRSPEGRGLPANLRDINQESINSKSLMDAYSSYKKEEQQRKVQQILKNQKAIVNNQGKQAQSKSTDFLVPKQISARRIKVVNQIKVQQNGQEPYTPVIVTLQKSSQAQSVPKLEKVIDLPLQPRIPKKQPEEENIKEILNEAAKCIQSWFKSIKTKRAQQILIKFKNSRNSSDSSANGLQRKFQELNQIIQDEDQKNKRALEKARDLPLQIHDVPSFQQMQIDSPIMVMQNSVSPAKDSSSKNEKLFETSKKSLLISIQKSKRTSQGNHHRDESISRNAAEEFSPETRPLQLREKVIASVPESIRGNDRNPFGHEEQASHLIESKSSRRQLQERKLSPSSKTSSQSSMSQDPLEHMENVSSLKSLDSTSQKSEQSPESIPGSQILQINDTSSRQEMKNQKPEQLLVSKLSKISDSNAESHAQKFDIDNLFDRAKDNKSPQQEDEDHQQSSLITINRLSNLQLEAQNQQVSHLSFLNHAKQLLNEGKDEVLRDSNRHQQPEEVLSLLSYDESRQMAARGRKSRDYDINEMPLNSNNKLRQQIIEHKQRYDQEIQRLDQYHQNKIYNFQDIEEINMGDIELQIQDIIGINAVDDEGSNAQSRQRTLIESKPSMSSGFYRNCFGENPIVIDTQSSNITQLKSKTATQKVALASARSRRSSQLSLRQSHLTQEEVQRMIVQSARNTTSVHSATQVVSLHSSKKPLDEEDKPTRLLEDQPDNTLEKQLYNTQKQIQPSSDKTHKHTKNSKSVSVIGAKQRDDIWPASIPISAQTPRSNTDQKSSVTLTPHKESKKISESVNKEQHQLSAEKGSPSRFSLISSLKSREIEEVNIIMEKTGNKEDQTSLDQKEEKESKMQRLLEMPLQICQIIPQDQPKQQEASTLLNEAIEKESLEKTLDKFPSEHEFDEPQVMKEKEEQKLGDEVVKNMEVKIYQTLIGKCIEDIIARQIEEQAMMADSESKEAESSKSVDKDSSRKNQDLQEVGISMRQAQIQRELDELQRIQQVQDKLQIKDQDTKDAQSESEEGNSQLIAGIDTSLETVDSYIEDILSQIRDRAPQFLNAFLTPIFRDPLEQLNLLQKAQIEYQLNGTCGKFNQNLGEHFSPNNSMVCILNVQLYLTLEKERESVIKEAIEQIKLQSEEEINEEELAEMISEADHIHNKAIFDCVNEAMNMVRPYGLQGEPMPWSIQVRQNMYLMVDDSDERTVIETLDKVVSQVKLQVIQWADTRIGGASSHKRQKSPPDMPKMLQSYENERLEQVVCQELREFDDKVWQGPNENFVGQVKLELSDMLLDKLVLETVNILSKIDLKRN